MVKNPRSKGGRRRCVPGSWSAEARRSTQEARESRFHPVRWQSQRRQQQGPRYVVVHQWPPPMRWG
jgi:hypothetical protein